MEKTVAVFHEGGVAQYSVQMDKDGNFVAHLIKYSGRSEHEPPQQITLHKEGRKWRDNENDKDLVDDIGSAIDLQTKAPEQPLIVTQNNDRQRGSDAGNRHP